MTSADSSSVIRVAIPSERQTGMLARVSPHFGKCEYFTVFEIAEGKPTKTLIVDNPPHRKCSDPVEFLKSQGVSVFIVKGIGVHPLAACDELGINVLASSGDLMGELIMKYTEGQLQQIEHRNICTH